MGDFADRYHEGADLPAPASTLLLATRLLGRATPFPHRLMQTLVSEGENQTAYEAVLQTLRKRQLIRSAGKQAFDVTNKGHDWISMRGPVSHETVIATLSAVVKTVEESIRQDDTACLELMEIHTRALGNVFYTCDPQLWAHLTGLGVECLMHLGQLDEAQALLNRIKAEVARNPELRNEQANSQPNIPAEEFSPDKSTHPQSGPAGPPIIPPMPDHIKTTRLSMPGSVLYEFSHTDLGPLGRVAVLPAPGDQTALQIDIAPMDPADANYNDRITAFYHLILNIYEAFRKQGHDIPHDPYLDRMPEAHRLYSRFVRLNHSLEMEQFAQQLTPDTHQLLLQICHQVIARASWHDAQAIQQRLADLSRYTEAQSPLEQGMKDFLEAETEEDAIEVLKANPVLLLTWEAKAMLESFEGIDREARSHIQERQSLWKSVYSNRKAYL